MRSREHRSDTPPIQSIHGFFETLATKSNYTMLRCSKYPQNHYGFLFVNQPCLAGCGGYGKWFEIDGETGQVIGPA